jgi:hypothetical protein
MLLVFALATLFFSHTFSYGAQDALRRHEELVALVGEDDEDASDELFS